MQPSVGIKKYVCLGVEGEGVGAVWGDNAGKKHHSIYIHTLLLHPPPKKSSPLNISYYFKLWKVIIYPKILFYFLLAVLWHDVIGNA